MRGSSVLQHIRTVPYCQTYSLPVNQKEDHVQELGRKKERLVTILRNEGIRMLNLGQKQFKGLGVPHSYSCDGLPISCANKCPWLSCVDWSLFQGCTYGSLEYIWRNSYIYTVKQPFCVVSIFVNFAIFSVMKWNYQTLLVYRLINFFFHPGCKIKSLWTRQRSKMCECYTLEIKLFYNILKLSK